MRSKGKQMKATKNWIWS